MSVSSLAAFWPHQGNLGRPGERFDFSAVKQYRDLAAVLGDADIDAVDLCLPTFLHEAVAVQALRAGKHVLVEKPMALEGAGARGARGAGTAGGGGCFFFFRGWVGPPPRPPPPRAGGGALWARRGPPRRH